MCGYSAYLLSSIPIPSVLKQSGMNYDCTVYALWLYCLWIMIVLSMRHAVIQSSAVLFCGDKVCSDASHASHASHASLALLCSAALSSCLCCSTLGHTPHPLKIFSTSIPTEWRKAPFAHSWLSSAVCTTRWSPYPFSFAVFAVFAVLVVFAAFAGSVSCLCP